MASALLGEADIRWFHTLGAVLVMAAMVGWLRAQWDGYGRTFAGLLIASAPFLLVWLGRTFRHSLPLSARLLENLGAFLVAPALLSVDLFDLLPLPLPSPIYQSLALVFSAALLVYRGWSSGERLPLMIGGFCAAVSGWPNGVVALSLGALASGALASGAGSYFEAVSDTEGSSLEPPRRPNAPRPPPKLASALQGIGIASIAFGCFATLFLFGTESNPGVPVAMLVAATLLLALPDLLSGGQALGGAARLAMQTFLAVGGAVMMRAALELPMPAVALYLLFAAALLLLAPATEKAGLASIRLGTFLGFTGLLVGFLESAVPQAMEAGALPSGQRLLLSAAGAALFGWHGRRKAFEGSGRERYGLAAAAAVALLGGWCHLSLPYCDPSQPSTIGFYPLWLSLPVFGLLTLLAGKTLLKPWEKEVALALTSTLLLFLIPVAVWSQLFDHTSSPYPWRWAGLMGLVAVASAALLSFRQHSVAPQLAGALHRLAPRLLVYSGLGTLALGADLYARWSLGMLGVGWLAVFLSHTLRGAFRAGAFEAGWLLLASATVFAPTLFQGPELRLWALAGLYAISVRPPEGMHSSLAAAGVWTLPTLVFVGHERLTPGVAGGVVAAYLIACWAQSRFDPGCPPGQPVSGTVGLDGVLIGAFLVAASWPTEGPARTIAPACMLATILLLAALRYGTRTRTRPFFPGSSLLVFLAAAQACAVLGRTPLESSILALGGGALLLVASRLVPQPEGFSEHPSSDLDPSPPNARSKDPHEARRLLLTEWSHANLALGALWLVATQHFPLAADLLLGVLLALEGLRWLIRWDPALSPAMMGVLLVVGNTAGSQETMVPVLLTAWAALLLLRVVERPGLFGRLWPLLIVGGPTLIFGASRSLALGGMDDWRWKAFSVALLLLPIGLRLCWRTDHPMLAGGSMPPSRLVGLGAVFLVGPWLTELALGHDQMVNFTWVLIWGCTFLGFSLIWIQAPEGLGPLLRRAGAATLSAWILISMGRAAYAISWQAGTLFVGLLCVAVGVVMERRRRLD